MKNVGISVVNTCWQTVISRMQSVLHIHVIYKDAVRGGVQSEHALKHMDFNNIHKSEEHENSVRGTRGVVKQHSVEICMLIQRKKSILTMNV